MRRWRLRYGIKSNAYDELWNLCYKDRFESHRFPSTKIFGRNMEVVNWAIKCDTNIVSKGIKSAIDPWNKSKQSSFFRAFTANAFTKKNKKILRLLWVFSIIYRVFCESNFACNLMQKMSYSSFYWYIFHLRMFEHFVC